MKLDNILKIVKICATIIPFIGILLYFLGSMYNTFYLKILGLQPNLFQNNIEENIMRGAVNIYGSVIFILLLLVIAPTILKFLFALFNKSKVYEWIETEMNEYIKNFISFLQSNKIIGLILVILIVNLLLFGKVVSNAYYNVIAFKTNTKYKDTIHIKNGNVIKGNIINCKDNHCGIYDGNKTITISLSEIKSIETKIKK